MNVVNVKQVIGEQSLSLESFQPHFLLTSKSGDMLLLGSPPSSNYDGWVVNLDGTRYKILSDIALSNELRDVTISDGEIIRKNDSGSQKLHLVDAGILGDLSGETTLVFDCKKMYDESENARVYRITKSENKTHAMNNLRLFTLHYEKTSPTIGEQSGTYHLFVSLATTIETTILESWRPASYPYDVRRGTHSTPWIFDAFRLTGDGRFALGVAISAKDAEHLAMDLLIRSSHHLERSTHQESTSHSSSNALSLSGKIALRSLHMLCTTAGTFAGLPWFFQVWSRDELIASGGFLCAGEYEVVQSILDRWFSATHLDGLLPAIYPDQGLESSDAPGWLAKRTVDFLNYCDLHAIILSPDVLVRWREGMERLLLRAKTKIHDALVWSERNTTWMDTAWNDDGREGACIEIQALTIALCEAYAVLCERTSFHPLVDARYLASSLRKSVRERFVFGSRLADHLRRDMSPADYLRPNIFLAWHACPDLFSNDEWSMFFRSSIANLWMPWGGFSSIERGSPLFHESATGEDVASYHRGDVWYYINNLAAIALHTVNAQLFSVHVLRLKDASERDLLSLGICGHASEISSASCQEPMGCHAQAWSAGTFVELVFALGKK